MTESSSPPAATGGANEWQLRESLPCTDLSGLRIAMILMGALIALPAFVMGAKLNQSLGTGGSVAASLGGGFVLACIAAAAAIVGARSRLSSYALIVRAFGATGGKLINAVLSVVMVGWFAVVAALFGDAALHSGARVVLDSARGWMGIGCVLMIATTLSGFRAIDILALLTTPLKVLLLSVTVVAALYSSRGVELWSPPRDPALSLPQGVSFVVGGVIVGALLTPDLARLAASKAQAALACFLAFALGLPLVLILAGIPAKLTGMSDLVEIMVRLGLGLPAVVIVIIAAWSSNAYNLYAITLVYRTLAVAPQWKLAAFGGAAGALLALAGIASHLTPYLLVLGIVIPPIAGVYLSAYYISWMRGETVLVQAWRPDSFMAWIAGVLAAALRCPCIFH
jgi:cytosine permease